LLLPAAGTPTISNCPIRAASGIPAGTDGVVGPGVAVGRRVGVGVGLGAGRVGVGTVVGVGVGVGDAVVGADARGAGGSAGVVPHAVATSATAAATIARDRTPRRYGTVATRSAGPA
jgi:hypothetical protein